MAFTTTPYTTLADVKNAIRGLATNEDDGFLTIMIQRVQTVIDTFCGYPFQQDGTTGSPTTRLFSGNDGLVLPIEKCQSITQVLEIFQNITAGYGGTYQETFQTSDITADVVLLPANQLPGYMIQRLTGCEFSQGINNIQISGVWGYASVPADVTLAATLLGAHYYGLRDTYYGSVLVQATQTIKYQQTIPDYVRELLKPYRDSYFTSGNFV